MKSTFVKRTLWKVQRKGFCPAEYYCCAYITDIPNLTDIATIEHISNSCEVYAVSVNGDTDNSSK